MRNCRAGFVVVFALMVSLIYSPFYTQAQQSQSAVDVRKVDGETVQTPVYSVKGPQTSGRAGDWFRVFVEYDTDADWLDEITVTFYVGVKGRTKDVPAMSVFKGTTTYMHIPKGREHVADMFLHPNIIDRYGSVEAIAVEIRMGGRVIARTGKPTPRDAWWERYSPSEGSLMNRSQTPFAYINLDKQEIIKPAATR